MQSHLSITHYYAHRGVIIFIVVLSNWVGSESRRQRNNTAVTDQRKIFTRILCHIQLYHTCSCLFSTTLALHRAKTSSITKANCWWRSSRRDQLTSEELEAPPPPLHLQLPNAILGMCFLSCSQKLLQGYTLEIVVGC